MDGWRGGQMSENRRAEAQMQELESLTAQLHAAWDDLDRYSGSSSSHISRLKERWRDPVSGAEIDRIAAEMRRQTELAKEEMGKISVTLRRTLERMREMLAQAERDEAEREGEQRNREDDAQGGGSSADGGYRSGY